MLAFILSQMAVNGQSWTKVNIPHDNLSYISEMKTPTATAIWGLQSLYDFTSGTQGPTNRFMRSADGGTTWIKKAVNSGNANYALSNIYPLDADTCYVAMFDGVVGKGGGIFKTTNGGTSWTQLGAGVIFDANSFPNWVYFKNAKQGIAMGDARGPGTKFEIWLTNNNGKSWTRVPDANIPAINNYPYGVVGRYYAYGNRIWFYAYEGDVTGARIGAEYLYRSDDGGKTWSAFPINNPVAGVLTDFVFTDEQNGVYIGQQSDGFGTPFILRSKDGGATWTNQSFTGPAMNAFLANIPGTKALVSTSGFLLGTADGSSYSLDYGKTWKIIDSGSTLLHTDVSYFNKNIGWTGQYVQTVLQKGGAYKWSLNIPEAFTDPATDVVNTTIQVNTVKTTPQITLRPNPVVDVVYVEGLSANKQTTLFVMDNAQRVMQQAVVNGASCNLNVSKLHTGNYFIKVMEANTEIATLKFVKE